MTTLIDIKNRYSGHPPVEIVRRSTVAPRDGKPGYEEKLGTIAGGQTFDNVIVWEGVEIVIREMPSPAAHVPEPEQPAVRAQALSIENPESKSVLYAA